MERSVLKYESELIGREGLAVEEQVDTRLRILNFILRIMRKN